MAKHTGHSAEKVKSDMERNYYMSAEQAKAYGIVDEVILPRKLADMSKK
jgi:ATP-dependent Clp protease protease subunit